MVGFKDGYLEYIHNEYIKPLIEDGFDVDDDVLHDTIPAYLEGAYQGTCYVALKSVEGNDMIFSLNYGIFDIETEEEDSLTFDIKLFNINTN